MSKFRLLSKHGDGLAIANKLQEEGHDVSAWIESSIDADDKDSGSYKNLYDGIIDKVDRPDDGLTPDTIIIIDSTGLKYSKSDAEATKIEKLEEDDLDAFIAAETWGDHLRDQGYKVIGGGAANELMEIDRKFGQELAEECGFRVPTEREFNDYRDALEFVQSTKKRYVLKPSGCKESYSVYPSRDWEDLALQLEHLIDCGEPCDKVILQEFTEGVQMGIEGTWTGEKLIGFNSTFEHKRLLAGHTGVLTGETGSIVFYYPDDSSKLCQMIKKLEPYLKEMNYPTGHIDCNFIINEEAAWFLEFTPRQGYPATYIQLFACEDWALTYDAIANGQLEEYFVKPDSFFGGINVFIPEYPYGKTRKDLVESPTFFQKIRSEHLDHISFIDVKIKDSQIVSGGTYGNLMCVSSSAASPREVNQAIVKIIKEIEIYPVGYRNDIGLELDEDIENLRKWGYWMPTFEASGAPSTPETPSPA